jgi:hypothetical protein
MRKPGHVQDVTQYKYYALSLGQHLDLIDKPPIGYEPLLRKKRSHTAQVEVLSGACQRVAPLSNILASITACRCTIQSPSFQMQRRGWAL